MLYDIGWSSDGIDHRGTLGIETHTDRGSLRPSAVGETRQISFFSKKHLLETLSSFLLSYLLIVVVLALFSNR